MGACRWKTTTHALLCSGATERRPKPSRKPLLEKPFITCPTLLDPLTGYGLRERVRPRARLGGARRLAEPRHGGDALQRPLHVRFRARLMPAVGRHGDVF